MEGTLETTESRYRSRGFVGWRLAAGFLLGAVVAAFLVSWFASWRRNAGPEVRKIDVSQPAILSKIQQLERLETVSFFIDKIVTGERESRYLPQFLSGDRLLLIVHGEVIAGIDLSKVQSDDIIVRNNILTVRIPKAEVFTVRIDNERTRVYSRETGLFSRVDPNLETEVRREAERQLREAAMEEGLLEIADKNAHFTLTRLLGSLGFERVELQ
jgi:predicted transcriptional regulator